MVRFGFCLGLSVLLAFGTLHVDKLNKDSKRENIRYNTAVVVSIGQCKNDECAYTYKTSTGNVLSGTSREPVAVGQLVYQMCWTEKVRGDRCYTEYSPSKR